MKKTIFVLLLGLFVNRLSANELRGIWVDAFGPGFQNKAQIKQLVSDCRQYNFNAVFVEMRKRGDAYYLPKAPNEDVRAEGLPADFDALAEIIKECHTGGPRIEVHCWMLAYFLWGGDKAPLNKAHVFYRHKDWLMKDSKGHTTFSQGYYLDPGNPDVSRYLLNTAKDVVGRYDVDGLHWDYLRYPVQDAGYNEVAIKRYKEEFNLKNFPAPGDSQFSEWRRRQVSDFVRWSTAELLAIKPKLVVSASVFSNYQDSRNYRMADWVAWNKEGIIDVSVPMDFGSENKFIFDPRAAFGLTNRWSREVWLGQGGYKNQKDNTLRQLKFSRDRGYSGTVFYSYRKPDLEDPKEISAEVERQFKVQPNVTIDNHNAKAVGAWRTNSFGKRYGKDYYVKTKGDGNSYVSFAPRLPASGEYDIYEWHVAGKFRAEKVPHVIIHDGKTNVVSVNQQSNGSTWNCIGRFSFDTNALTEVRICDGLETNKIVAIADAIRFVQASTNADTAPLRTHAMIVRSNQVDTFQFIKEHHQPTWENSSKLAWKSNPRFGIVKGAVEGTDGKPIYNATLKLDGALVSDQKTEPHGQFAFFDVKPGEHELIATGKGFLSVTNKVVCHAGGMSKVSVVLAQ